MADEKKKSKQFLNPNKMKPLPNHLQ